MIERPVFKRHYHVEPFSPEGVFLLSEHGHHHLSGRPMELVAPLLNGHWTADQIAEILSPQVSMAEVYYALEKLEKDGHIGEADFWTPDPQAAFWSSLGIDSRDVWDRYAKGSIGLTALLPETVPVLTNALAQHGLQVAPEGDLNLVVVADYLADELEEINAKALETGRPWMLVKPIGTHVWIGPIFVPDRTGCWECLAQRLRGHRDLEVLLKKFGRPMDRPLAKAALPSSIEHSLSLAALHASLYMAAGGNPALEGRVVTQDLVRMQTHTHWLVRRPQCPACGDGEMLSRRRQPIVLNPVPKSVHKDGGHRPTTPEQMLATYQHHLSPVTGVISQLIPWTPDPNQPLRVYVADHNFALMHDLKFFLRDGIRSNSSGKGMTDVQARASAVGESIERYSGVFREEEARQLGRMEDFGGDAINPHDLMLYSDRQLDERDRWVEKGSRFNFVPQRMPEDAELEWSPVWSMTEKKFKWLPTGYLYYGYPNDPENIYCWADSNGCAAGSTLEDAILQGFLELIERDGVAIWWYNRLSRPAVDLDSFNLPYVDEIRAYYKTRNREFWVLDLTTDFGIPVFAALNRRTDHEVEDIIMGFGAHLDPTVALTRALTEMNQFMPAVLPRDENGNAVYAFNDPECIHWWSTATLANQPYLKPKKGKKSKLGDFQDLSSDDISADVRLLIDLAESKGHEVLVLDHTRPDLGLPVAKVMVPGIRHFWARFAPGRLYDVPVEMGWLKKPLTEDELNPTPMFI